MIRHEPARKQCITARDRVVPPFHDVVDDSERALGGSATTLVLPNHGQVRQAHGKRALVTDTFALLERFAQQRDGPASLPK